MIQAYVSQIKMNVNQRLGSFLDQLGFVHKNKTQVFLLGLIDVFNRAENDLDFKRNAQAHKSGVFKVDMKFFHII